MKIAESNSEQNPQEIIPVEPEHLSGIDGLNKLRESTASVEGISLNDLLATPEGRERFKTKKIILAGPPRSGKSCMREALKGAIKQIPNAPYPYMLTACPDGEGAWFQETMNSNPDLAAKLKAEYKAKFTPEFVERIAQSVHNLSLPLSFIDIGGITSPENEKICKDGNGAVLICGETATLSGKPAEWKEFFTKLGIPIVAEVYSDYFGEADDVEGTEGDGVFRGSVHHLERGEQLNERETVKALAEFIVDLGAPTKP